MRRLATMIRNLFGPRPVQRVPSARSRRLTLECLEERALLAANFTGSITGTVYVDFNANQVRDPDEFLLRNVNVSLSGTTSGGQGVSASVVSNDQGQYTFAN